MISLSQALAQLPDAADEIAAYLTAQECRGVREIAECCPIANWLTGQGFEGVQVDTLEICTWGERGVDQVEVTDGISDFVTRFDQGQWPDLEVDDA